MDDEYEKLVLDLQVLMPLKSMWKMRSSDTSSSRMLMALLQHQNFIGNGTKEICCMGTLRSMTTEVGQEYEKALTSRHEKALKCRILCVSTCMHVSPHVLDRLMPSVKICVLQVKVQRN